ncbi:MAG: tetraacyldisaccharide 4'-kinase [Bacteroidetes bacterium]|nr:tetraacyldisaccharide 4'-kinase [Bacteroidota bacterium]
MLRSFRYLLFPLSLVYGAVVWLRNWLFDLNILKSAQFNFPIICIGNIAVGGTGKTPMVEYLIRLLQDDYLTATLSRGYKRKTRGFAIADASTTALEIGDEPMQFHTKYPRVTVAVGEERLVAIPQLLHDRQDTQVIILDDAFQHRPVHAGMNIVLTAYNNLYSRDLMLPAGDLRDVKASMNRAQIIVVTKCKPNLSLDEKNAIARELRPAPHQHLFFTALQYGILYHLFSQLPAQASKSTAVLLLCGIANPRPLKDYIDHQFNSYDMLRYPDHHIFNMDDLAEIKRQFDAMAGTDKIIVTTEKDAVRLMKFDQQLKDYPIYVIPIEHKFLFNEGPVFEQLVVGFIDSFKK